MGYRADVALATNEEGRKQIQPFVDALFTEPSVIKVGEYTIFYWQYVKWDIYFDPDIIKFEEEMKKLSCFEFAYHGEDAVEWRVGETAPGILFTGIGYYDKDQKKLLD